MLADEAGRIGIGLAPRIMAAARPVDRAIIQRQNHFTEIIEFSRPNVSSACCDETILPCDETIFPFRADIRKQPLVISYQRNGAQRLSLNRRQPMRTISFILGFAFILAGPSIAGSSDGSLPGIGTFSYSAPASTVAPTVVAAN
jgi:hypothetical protein